MTEYRDIGDMIEILNLAIVRQETEEEFFRRSARHSTSQVAISLFGDIADELESYVKLLEGRREKLMLALDDLKSAKKTNKIAEHLNRDPVCEMKIDTERCNFSSSYDNRQYRFCSEDCKRAFDLDPEKYLKDNKDTKEKKKIA